MFFYLLLFCLTWQPTLGQQGSFNLSSAECYDCREVVSINLFKEWSAYNETSQYCYDNHGSGYFPGNTFKSCGGCMNYVCVARPCLDRDGTEFKLYWELESISPSCCQDCEGKVIPPGKSVTSHSTDIKNNEGCQIVEQSICKINLDTASSITQGMIEVTYESPNCCSDPSGWTPVSSSPALEPQTCSVKTCMSGQPAHWDRRHIFERQCGCCQYASVLYQNGEQLEIRGEMYQCCDGDWAEPATEHSSTPITVSTSRTETDTTEVEGTTTTTSTSTTMTSTSTTTTSTSTTTTSTSTTTTSASTTMSTTSTTTALQAQNNAVQQPILVTVAFSSDSIHTNSQIGSSLGTYNLIPGEKYNSRHVYKLATSQNENLYLFYSLDGYWTISGNVGGKARIRTVIPGLEDPPSTGWLYFYQGQVIEDTHLTAEAQYHFPGYYKINSNGGSSELWSSAFGVYSNTGEMFSGLPVYKKTAGNLEYFFFFSESFHRWMVGMDLSDTEAFLKAKEAGHVQPPVSGWKYLEGSVDGVTAWISDMHLTVQPYNVSQVRKLSYMPVELKEMWNDHGSHSINDFSCYKPMIPTIRARSLTFGMLSSIPFDDYKTHNEGYIFASEDPTAFSNPERYNMIWSEKGMEGDQKGSFWEPICPEGYRAVGIYCQSGRLAPALTAMQCIAEEFTMKCKTEWIWNTQNSDARWNVTVSKTTDTLVQGMIAIKGYTMLEEGWCLNIGQ